MDGEITSRTGKYYLYVKVIETHGVLGTQAPSDLLCSFEPFVTIKLNGHEFLHKKSTKYHSGVEWWEQTFRFKITQPDLDWVAVEVREKGLHLLGSDWIGEVQLRVKDFMDGKVHENWYKLGKGAWKNHSRQPRGYIHLSIHLLPNKYRRPFEGEEPSKRLSFEEWRAQGMPQPGKKNLEPTSTHREEQDPNTLHSHFDLEHVLSMQQAEKNIRKNAHKILSTEHPTSQELLNMKKYNRVNCLHKGNFTACTGKRYLIAVDGTKSSRDAFEATLKLVDPKEDHIFIVTVRERAIPDDYFEERSRVILAHKIWNAAADIIRGYQELLDDKYEYTSIMPEADDAREMLCALVKKYQVDYLIIGKHKGQEKKHTSRHFRSFKNYCQRHAKCSVMVF